MEREILYWSYLLFNSKYKFHKLRLIFTSLPFTGELEEKLTLKMAALIKIRILLIAAVRELKYIISVKKYRNI